MLSYFRINDPYRLLGLLVIMLLMYLPLFIDSPGITFPELRSIVIGEKVHEGFSLYGELVDWGGPFAGWFDGLLDMLFGRSLLGRHIFAFVVIFTQAAYVGILFSNRKAFSENTYIPSLVFGILCCFSFDTLSLTPQLLGNGFLLLALGNLFTEIEFREQRNESVFNLGLFISFASLFSFSFGVYIFAAIVTLAVFTRHPPRKYLLLICGFALPHLFIISSYYLKGSLPDLWQYYYLKNITLHFNTFISPGSMWILGALPLAVLVVALVMMNRDSRFTKYQSQLVQSMFLWMIFTFLQVLFSEDWRPQSFITLVPIISFFVSHYLLLIRRRKFAEINIWVLLVGTVLVCYLSRYGMLGGVDYSKLLVKNEPAPEGARRVLVLDDGWNVYKNAELASPFLDWELSKEIFDHPEYYENVLRVHKGLKNDPPQIIRDKDNKLGPFLERIPDLKSMYVRKGIYYVPAK